MVVTWSSFTVGGEGKIHGLKFLVVTTPWEEKKKKKMLLWQLGPHFDPLLLPHTHNHDHDDSWRHVLTQIPNVRFVDYGLSLVFCRTTLRPFSGERRTIRPIEQPKYRLGASAVEARISRFHKHVSLGQRETPLGQLGGLWQYVTFCELKLWFWFLISWKGWIIPDQSIDLSQLVHCEQVPCGCIAPAHCAPPLNEINLGIWPGSRIIHVQAEIPEARRACSINV